MEAGKLRWSDLVEDLTRNTSQTRLAERAGATPKEVGRWKRGEARPTGRHAENLIAECEQQGVNWRKYQGVAPVYDFRSSYDKNVAQGPQGLRSREELFLHRIPTRLLDVDLNSPIGVPASVLTISSKWISPLAALGFDIITAKTCRTKGKPAHPFPNCVYLPELQKPADAGCFPDTVLGTPDPPPDEHISEISLANSFGMPSPEPKEWQADLEASRDLLKPGQMLIASVVGTADANGDDLAADFVQCARLAAEARPHAIELNFSCPNAYGEERAVYQHPELAGRICSKVSRELRGTKLLVKIGHLSTAHLDQLFEATCKYVSGYTAINTIAARIRSGGQQREPVFSGKPRVKAGVSGVAIREHALAVVRRLRYLAEHKKVEVVLLGVGGISSADDVRSFRDAGANGFQICTAALLNPFVAAEIRAQLVRGDSPLHRSLPLERNGMPVSFSDPITAKAVELTVRVSARRGIPFDRALIALSKNWLDPYMREIDSLSGTGDPVQKTRRQAPTESDIERWVADEFANKKVL